MRHLRLMILLLAAAFAVALVGTRALFVAKDTEASLQRTAAGAEDLSRIVEEYARRTFETADLVAADVMAHVAAAGGVAALPGRLATQDYLRQLAARSNHDFITVVDAAGRLVATNCTAPPPGGGNFAGRAWVRAHQAGARLHVGQALAMPDMRGVLFTFSRAIRQPDGGLEGVVLVAIQPRFFQDGRLTADSGRNAVLGLWTANGEVIGRTHLQPEEVNSRITMTAPLVQALRDGQVAQRLVSPLDGRDRMVSFRRVDGWPVVATASLPVEVGLAAYAKAHGWSAWVTGASLVVVGLLASFALRLSLQAETAANAVAAARLALEARVQERTQDLAEANRRLAQSEERYRGIFNASFQFISLLAPDGTVLEANETALGFVGASAAAVAGQPFWEAAWWPADAAGRARLRDAVAGAAAGAFLRDEVTVQGTERAAATIDFSLKPVRNAAGEVVLLVAEGRDISELKAAQAQLHEAQKLETLGQLTGGVAHDFNNLLMVILGNLALLKKRLGNEEPRVVRLLDGATQGAERGAALTRRLLAFARRQELRPEPIDLARLVLGMEELLRRTVGPLCQIIINIPAGLPQALADVNQVELALLNLAVNARDAMPAGGELRITARQGHTREAGAPAGLAPGAYLCLAVSDSGTGMDAGTLARATEPFFTTKGPGKGSGLGLSMVHGLAAQSGGQLRIISTEGLGTTVEIWLPVDGALTEPAAPAPPSGPVPAQAGCRPLSVLLVDDDPLVQAGSAAMLEDLGHRVTLASSGTAALKLLAGIQDFDLMITDFAMPGMDGLELARRARRMRPLLPVVLATGFAELASSTESTLPRLDKPYRQEALAALIGRMMAPPSPGEA